MKTRNHAAIWELNPTERALLVKFAKTTVELNNRITTNQSTEPLYGARDKLIGEIINAEGVNDTAVFNLEEMLDAVHWYAVSVSHDIEELDAHAFYCFPSECSIETREKIADYFRLYVENAPIQKYRYIYDYSHKLDSLEQLAFYNSIDSICALYESVIDRE